jgi:hypothetical protein
MQKRDDSGAVPAGTPSPRAAEMTANMTAEQAARLKSLAEQAYEPEAFKPTLDRAEAARRIAVLEAKLRLLDEPPHTL